MRVVAAAVVVAATVIASAAGQPVDRSIVGERVRSLTRDTVWTPVARVPMKFATHHPQGMVKIGDTLFVSSVEVKVRTTAFVPPKDGYDRDTGEGVGHIFKVDLRPGSAGALLASSTIGEGSIYHPGGIDFDGVSLWVPVAEYRPNSRSIVYKVNPDTLAAAAVVRVADHIGGVVRNTDDNTLHGVSWGSRRFYRWTMDAAGNVTNAAAAAASIRMLNPSHYVDYQDCKYAGRRAMLCGGVSTLRPASGGPGLRLGGLDLIDLADSRPLHQVPVALWTASGLPMTQNPAWIEPHGDGLRAYFMPEDDKSVLYVYDVRQP